MSRLLGDDFDNDELINLSKLFRLVEEELHKQENKTDGLDEDEWNDIPESTFRPQDVQTEASVLQQSPMCPVCQNNFAEGEVVKELRCNHSFHKNCLKQWVDHNKTCPTCRANI